jgi:AAHS family 4-hydroxybenzoate transporter-like MFS transporter
VGRVSGAIDVGALLDHGRWTAQQKRWTILAALAVIFDGFDIQILGFAIPSLIREWHVARSAFGPVLALGLAGMAVGSPFAGYCGDRFGRRTALIGCVSLFGLATIASSFVDGVAWLAVLRVLTGMGAGGALPNAAALSAEFAPLRQRHAAVLLTIVCVPLGGMIGGVIASQVLPVLGWRALYVIGGATPLAFAILLWLTLPESPRFLARSPEDRERLAALLRRMGHTVDSASIYEDRTKVAADSRAPIRALFGAALARDTVGLWIAYFFCLGSIYVMFGWLPTLLTSQGISVATATTGLAIYNLGGVCGVVVWTFLISAFGSRGPMLAGALGTAASALLVLLIPFHANSNPIFLLAAIGLNGLLANAIQTSIYALAAHVYPTAVRASGVAYAAAIGRTGGVISSLFGAVLIQAGPVVFWWAMAAAMVLAFVGLASVRNHFAAAGKLEPAGVAAS